MNVKLATAWVAMAGYDNSTGVLEIEGVGRQSIDMPLPTEIKDQIEAFYVAEYRRRLTAALEAA